MKYGEIFELANDLICMSFFQLYLQQDWEYVGNRYSKFVDQHNNNNVMETVYSDIFI